MKVILVSSNNKNFFQEYWGKELVLSQEGSILLKNGETIQLNNVKDLSQGQILVQTAKSRHIFKQIF